MIPGARDGTFAGVMLTFACILPVSSEARQAASDRQLPTSACAQLSRDEIVRLEQHTAEHRPRSGITGYGCRLGGGTRLSVLSQEQLSWPIVETAGQQPVSLEDLFLSLKQWAPWAGDTTLIHVDGRPKVSLLGNPPRAVIVRGYVTDTLTFKRTDVYIVLRLSPTVCLVDVSLRLADAHRLARSGFCGPAPGASPARKDAKRHATASIGAIVPAPAAGTPNSRPP